ncbi:DUF262 domain-containing protein [Arthrobacter sp. CG_A4]|uniref:DUF262 domain-containing protein n=1 Tax=Arthrobacter sp. CG_A4 TaxID=3071706 RepID=UPI002E0C5C39|nr:hypothetical protein [Arthrobacter sp. CG_A4]
MRGFKTSFVGMFQAREEGMPSVSRVEIPLIQRDYAQGRETSTVNAIRHDFLDVLVAAITGGDPVDLDFVYGDIRDGTLWPLDGQQRLTTLFLIHWYVAVRTKKLAEADRWLKFTYATRPTAELFCRQIVKPSHLPPTDFTVPSDWITDQAWYLFAWRHDPTVQSMLVMLDAIHERLSVKGIDLDVIWRRLTDTVDPVVSFHFLPIDDMPSGEELYIKMNSRGKPLTEFENFKARFEGILAESLLPARFNEIVHKLDGAWSDVLWPYHGDDYIVDDEFLRYLEFIIEICEWREGGVSGGRLLDRAERVFSNKNPKAQSNLTFLFHAFDTWIGIDVDDVFTTHFARAGGTGLVDTDRAILFETRNVNLFEECCSRYGQVSGRPRLFSLSETLFLYAVLIHRQFETTDFQVRLRILRNLTDRSDEIRENRMVDLVASVERLIRRGAIEDLKGFNPDRVADEQLKREFLDAHPNQKVVLNQLEDHPLLRGRVFAFDLNPEVLEGHARSFAAITRKEHWPALSAALLAKGNYGYPIGNRAYQYGSMKEAQELRWREVFTHYGRGKNGELPSCLGTLLDEVGISTTTPAETLSGVANAFSQQRRSQEYLDWRYYVVSYADMREGDTGIYFGEHLPESGKWGYSMCMLRTNSLTGGARFRDPFLLAAWRESGVSEAVRSLWFSGYESEPRWLRLTESDIGIRCVNLGFELDASPLDEQQAEKFQRVCEKYGATEGSLLPVEQARHGGELVDTEDRVQKCAAFLLDLVAEGL